MTLFYLPLTLLVLPGNQRANFTGWHVFTTEYTWALYIGMGPAPLAWQDYSGF